jgi:hypothetical protein
MPKPQGGNLQRIEANRRIGRVSQIYASPQGTSTAWRKSPESNSADF